MKGRPTQVVCERGMGRTKYPVAPGEPFAHLSWTCAHVHVYTGPNRAVPCCERAQAYSSVQQEYYLEQLLDEVETW